MEKFIGDAVMAVFGAPLAHEDDAERAIRAGLRILDAIAEANADDPALDLKVRIGINTGEAVVSLGARPEQGEGFVTGDVVNTASRLQGVAPVNGIAVGEATHEATASIFEFEELEPVELKGKAGAGAAVVGEGSAVAVRHRRHAHAPPRHSWAGSSNATCSPRPFDAPSATDRVHLVTVVGEPGIGKIAARRGALRAISDRSPDLVTWRQGRCLPYGEGIAFWALGEIVKAARGDPRKPTRRMSPPQKIDSGGARPNRPTPAGCAQRLRPLVGLERAPAAGARGELRARGDGSWRSVAGDGPLVLVVEDLPLGRRSAARPSLRRSSSSVHRRFDAVVLVTGTSRTVTSGRRASRSPRATRTG